MSTETITITFGDMAENHVGMQKIGKKAQHGFGSLEFGRMSAFFEGTFESKTELIDLRTLLSKSERKDAGDTNKKLYPEDAKLLIIRGGVQSLLGLEGKKTKDLMTELTSFEWDTKAKMYGRVVNKTARHNVCFGHVSQEPEYENGKGRIISWSDVELLAKIKSTLEYVLFEEHHQDLQAEGNLYYDVTKCGIGWHGDSERKQVLALRLGADMNIAFQWYQNGETLGEMFVTELHNGDMYVMSEKATGHDWKKKKIKTLRHAGGCKKFVGI